MRYRRRELRHWGVEADATAYWDTMSNDDKQTRVLRVQTGHWGHVSTQLDAFTQRFSSEASLRGPFEVAFRGPHNLTISAITMDAHEEIWNEAAAQDGDPRISNPPIMDSGDLIDGAPLINTSLY